MLERSRTSPFARAAFCCGCVFLVHSSSVRAGSLQLLESAPSDYDYAVQTLIPGTFGAGEFTFEVWLRLDDAYPVGAIIENTPAQLTNWSSNDPTPYGAFDWWYRGNFLLDGHNNGDFRNGTFSLQFYGGGRVRWDFGDGASPTGGHWAVQASPASTAPSLLDGQWHSIACVRRWSGATSASLELWIDGALIAFELSDRRTDLRTAYWNSWIGYPSGQAGWFWGAEKQAAIGANGVTQYEDYKGLVDEVRFWSRAKSVQELEEDWAAPLMGNETDLDGWYRFGEESGTNACDDISGTNCWSLVNTTSGNWSTQESPADAGPDSSYLYVDFAAAPGGNGTETSPFDNLDAAIDVADDGATIEIAPSSTSETALVTKQLTLLNGNPDGGGVQIGLSAGRGAGQAQGGFVAGLNP